MTDSDGDWEAQADCLAAQGELTAADQLLTTGVAAQPRFRAFVKLSAIRRRLGDLDGAMVAITSALAVEPLDFIALLMRASLLRMQQKEDEAAIAYEAAVFHAPPDERLSPSIRAELVRAREIAAAHAARREARLAALADIAMEAATPIERHRIGRFASNITRRTRAYAQAPSHFHFPGMPVVEFYSRDVFPCLAALEAETAAIAGEFEKVIRQEAAELVPYVQYPADVPLAQWRSLNHSRDWTAIHLWRQGERVERNARHCPRTMELFSLLDQPRIPGCGPNLMFSLLAPHTRIPPHTGVANTRLVLHLPLVVPPSCGFRVGAETRAWERGKAFVFDDTIEHEAWNNSDELRVVLIGDLWQPSLTTMERMAVGAMMAEGEMPTVL